MAMQAGPLKIHKDIAKDVLMVQQVTKGKFGAAQLQIALNLTPVRALAKKILDDKVSEISGARQRHAHPRAVHRLANRLAIRGICGFSVFSSKGPLAALNQSPTALAQKAGTTAGAKYARVNKIVAEYKANQLKKYGGFDGLKKKIAQHREVEASNLLAKGIPPQIVQSKKDRQQEEDAWVIHESARQLGLEEVKDSAKEDRDESSGFTFNRGASSAGWNPFKRKKKMSPQQRMDAAAAREDAAKAESEAREAENKAKEAEDALKDGGTIPPGDDGDAPKDGAAGLLTVDAQLNRLRKIARIKRHRAHHAKRRFHRAMKAGTMSGVSTAETAASSAVPGGPATMAVAKFAYKKGGKKHAASAVKLAKARDGDPAAIASIKATNDRAKKGDKAAQAEMKRLNNVNNAAKAVQRQKGFYSKMLRSGVAGFRPSTKGSGPTVEAMYGDTLASGCS